MEIKTLTTETVEWDAFVRSTVHGSPFHLLAWKRVVEAAFGHRPHYLLASGSDRVEGVLPLFEVPGVFGGRGLVSVPYGVYGGVCAASAEARTALPEAATGLARERPADFVELRHPRGPQVDLPPKPPHATFGRPIPAGLHVKHAGSPRN